MVDTAMRDFSTETDGAPLLNKTSPGQALGNHFSRLGTLFQRRLIVLTHEVVKVLRASVRRWTGTLAPGRAREVAAARLPWRLNAGTTRGARRPWPDVREPDSQRWSRAFPADLLGSSGRTRKVHGNVIAS